MSYKVVRIELKHEIKRHNNQFKEDEFIMSKRIHMITSLLAAVVGSVLGNRLTEDKDKEVLVLEADVVTILGIYSFKCQQH